LWESEAELGKRGGLRLDKGETTSPGEIKDSSGNCDRSLADFKGRSGFDDFDMIVVNARASASREERAPRLCVCAPVTKRYTRQKQSNLWNSPLKANPLRSFKDSDLPSTKEEQSVDDVAAPYQIRSWEAW